MKKIMTISIAALFFCILPIDVAKAEVLMKEQKELYTAEVKQKKQIIKEKSKAIKKLELEIDDKGDELGKALMLLFDRELPPNDEKLAEIEDKQGAMLQNIQELVLIERRIKRITKEANIDVAEQNLQQALTKFDKVIVLLNQKEEIIKEYAKNLQEFIDLLKSLQFK